MCGLAGSLLRHRTVHACSTSVMHQEFLVLRMDSCIFYRLYGMVPLVDPFQILPCGKEEDIVVVLVSRASGVPFWCALQRSPSYYLISRIQKIRWAWGFTASSCPIQSVLSLDTYDCCARCGISRNVSASTKECYLVDPASSHMLVSKIKPCMCKYELIQTVKLRMAH